MAGPYLFQTFFKKFNVWYKMKNERVLDMNLFFSWGIANPTATMDNATQQKSIIAAVLVEPISLGRPRLFQTTRVKMEWWLMARHQPPVCKFVKELVLVEGMFFIASWQCSAGYCTCVLSLCGPPGLQSKRLMSKIVVVVFERDDRVNYP